MKKLFTALLLFLLGFLFFALSPPAAFGDEISKAKTNALAEFELGADSWSRRYVRPHIRFEFSLDKKTSFFFSFSHYQVMNKQLSGLADFWIRGGFLRSFSDSISIELSVNHMSRHITRYETPQIFDVNELIAKAWYQKSNLRLGFGGGVFISDRWESYGKDNLLLVSNLDYSHILGSEFSLNSEVKLVNFSLFLWELELRAELSNNIDLFVKNIKHYPGYPSYEPNPSFYAGIRFKNNAGNENAGLNDLVTKVKLKPYLYIASENYRGHLEQEIYFEFMRKEKSRFALALNLDIPVFKGESLFLGTYRIENLSFYPFSFEYEKKLSQKFFLGAYCGNKFELPMDVKKEAATAISLGLFARNQHHFDDVGRNKLRYEFLLGRNFQEDYELGAKLGANTSSKKLCLGTDLKLFANANYSQASLELFLNIRLANQVSIRPFAEFKSISSAKLDEKFFFSFGVCLLKF
ncbi:MAG TPA: hypothetical protein VJ461_01340 [Candidatus Nanoarchaeia archaeon]|nr:hypothetical protein [Candidatus Nanoarchaeia archaeon]